MKKIIPYGKQSINQADITAVTSVLKSDYLTSGPIVKKFEEMFAKYVGSKFALTCTNGTSALLLSLLAINTKKNDVIILPVINFIASINMANILQAKIFFCDVDPFSGQMRPEDLMRCIKKHNLKKIKAIITMHNSGAPNYAEEFFKLKKKYNFYIIEDACHALGAKYSIKKNLKVGNCKFSDLTTFSFHPVKSITTGEGGMITFNNRKFFKKISLIRNHGIDRKQSNQKIYNWSYKVVCSGYNFRLNDIQSALGISQLKKLNNFIIKRNNIFKLYSKYLKQVNNLINLPVVKKNIYSAHHLYIINLKKNKKKITREEIIKKLFHNKIISQVHYIPVYLHPLFKNFKKNNFLGAKQYFKNSLSIPIFPDLKKNQVKFICRKLIEIIK